MTESVIGTRDSIDYILDLVSSRLISAQTIDFKRLRQVTALSNNKVESVAYCNVIVLAILRYFSIGDDLSKTLGNANEALRFYNALNLDDPKINTFFVEMILVIAPDITTSISAVLTRLISELTISGLNNTTRERLAKLERRLNKRIENNEIILEAEEKDTTEFIIPRNKSEAVTRPSSNKFSLNDYYEEKHRRAMVSRFGVESIEADKRARRAESQASKSSGKVSDRFIPLNSVAKGISKTPETALSIRTARRDNVESARETAKRLAKGKGIDPYDTLDPDDSASVAPYRRPRKSSKVSNNNGAFISEDARVADYESVSSW